MPSIEFGNWGDPLETPETISFRNVLGGAILSQEIILAGSNSVLRSQNYDASTAGWAIFGDGTMEIAEVTARDNITVGSNGQLQSSNYNGTGTGWAIFGDGTIDAGALTARNYITLSSTGWFRTASSGARIELGGSIDHIALYTADSFENLPATIAARVSGTGSTRTLQTQIRSPKSTGDTDGVFLILRTESNDDSNSPPGVVIGYGGGSTQTPVVTLNQDTRLGIEDGTKAAPSLYFNTYPTTGFYLDAANEIGMVLNSNGMVWVNLDGTTSGNGVQLRTESNPDNGDSLFEVASSSGAARFAVMQNQGSNILIGEKLTDIGNHEILRAQRGTTAALTEVGYYSSWAHLKRDIEDITTVWDRDWFMNLRPVTYIRKATGERELGFTIDNLIEDTNYLTTRGERVGDSPDEYAIMAVLVDYVQHLEERVAHLEERVAHLELFVVG